MCVYHLPLKMSIIRVTMIFIIFIINKAIILAWLVPPIKMVIWGWSPPAFLLPSAGVPRVPHLFREVDGLVEHVAPNPHQPQGYARKVPDLHGNGGKPGKR